MPLYWVTKEKLEPVKQTTFIEERFFERKDLQRLSEQCALLDVDEEQAMADMGLAAVSRSG